MIVFKAETKIKINKQSTNILMMSAMCKVGAFDGWASLYNNQVDGETMETVTDFIFGAPKSLQMVTAATN